MQYFEWIPGKVAELERAGIWVAGEVGYGLSRGTLAFISGLVEEYRVKHVFEFGSGKSTKVLLDCDCEVTSLENDPHWLDETLAQIPLDQQHHLNPICKPLTTVFETGYPCLGWRVDSQIGRRLQDAQFVLIDSPAFPPFREAALMQALRQAPHALILLDDLRIETLRRFCARIVRQSEDLAWSIVNREHHFALFWRTGETRIRNRPDAIELVKGLRRYLIGRRTSG